MVSFLQAVVVYICSLLVLSTAQYFGGFNYFGNGFDSALTSSRDPRQNPGPVVFPPAPPDSGETSGVVVGASGYGFVPPNSKILQFYLFLGQHLNS